MTAVRHIDVHERRRRLLVRHHLASPAATPEQVAGDLVGLHSTDPATVVLSLRARLDPFKVGDLEDALYERRTLLRMLAMRRTMFVVPLDLAAVMNASCTRALVPGERRKLVAMLEEGAFTDDVEAWIERVGEETLAALHAHGPLPASGLTKVVPDLGRQLRVAVGKKYEGLMGVSTRMLFLLSTEGRIARARPLGTLAVEPVPLGPDGRLDRRPARPRRGRGADRARPAVAARLRPGHGRRPGVVDEVDQGQRARRARRRRGSRRDHRPRRRCGGGGVGRSGRPRRHASRSRRPGRRRGGVAAAVARPDDHGVEGAVVVPRAAPDGAVRPQRQRRADGVGRRSGGRRVESARGRHRRHPPARGRRRRRGDPRRRRRAAIDRVDGRCARDAAVPDPARPGAGRRTGVAPT